MLSEEASTALCPLLGCSQGQELGQQQPYRAEGYQQRPGSARSLSGGHSRASQCERKRGPDSASGMETSLYWYEMLLSVNRKFM